MAYNITSLLEDAKRLAEKLRSDEMAANDLWNQANDVQLKTDALNQLSAKIDYFNAAAKHRPKKEIVEEIEESCRKVLAYQKDNADLTQTIKDHRDALSFMLSRYKTHMTKLEILKEAENSVQVPVSARIEQKEEILKDRLEEMVSVIKTSTELDNSLAKEDEKYIQGLAVDNERYRQNFHNVESLLSHETSEEEVQTEDDCDSELNRSNSSTSTVIDAFENQNSP